MLIWNSISIFLAMILHGNHVRMIWQLSNCEIQRLIPGSIIFEWKGDHPVREDK